jgi:serine protease AprX
MSGTSMSTPHVAGSAALLLHQKPNLSPLRVKELLQRTAKRLRGYSYKVQGAGLINVKSAVQHIGR